MSSTVSTVTNLPKHLDVVARMEGGEPLAAVLERPKSKRLSDLVIRIKYQKKTYNLAHFYNYYTKRFNISTRFGLSTVGFYGVLDCLFVGDRSVRALLETLPPAGICYRGGPETTPRDESAWRMRLDGWQSG